VIVHDFHLVSIVIQPLETNTPLIVDANAVLTLPVPGKGLQPDTRRSAQVIRTRRKMKLGQNVSCYYVADNRPHQFSRVRSHRDASFRISTIQWFFMFFT